MRESSAAEILPVAVTVNGQVFWWTPTNGLDASVVAQVEGWIQRRAESYLPAAIMRGLDRDDLLQEGRSGALKAARDYDPAFGAGYLSYADHWIRQAMRAALGRSHDVYLAKRARQQAVKDGELPLVLRLDAHLRDEDAALSDLLPAAQPDPQDQAEQAERESALRRALNRLEAIARFMGFIDARRGRCIPFWLPTYSRDMEQSQDASASDLSVRIRNVLYSTHIVQHHNRCDLAFYPLAGAPIFRRITGSAPGGMDHEWITLDQSFGQARATSDWRCISYLSFVRLDQDSLRMVWETDDLLRASFRVKEVLL
ncbi:sigma factor [Geothrix sp. PMB-07]|uniref:sigma factor n=1 Tax=Geothrix sp. PMB-07 TaxID=3068640 RepID=UPI0027406B8B|nr:sigma factor [Geothrix sp. PMB-07]WLT30762.1 sigma factor [Geothrix sp. PMB-07]